MYFYSCFFVVRKYPSLAASLCDSAGVVHPLKEPAWASFTRALNGADGLPELVLNTADLMPNDGGISTKQFVLVVFTE